MGQKFFEDFVLGETFDLPSKTLTESHFLMFAALTGANHPIHHDLEYCRQHGYPERMAHGYLVALQTVLGASLASALLHDTVVAFLEASSRFLKPVFVGDTLYPRLRVTELVPRRTTGLVRLRAAVQNHHGDTVLDGQHAYIVKKRHPSAEG